MVEKSVTVVTAYYPIKSKHAKSNYIRWICDFWPATTCPLVFFTEPAIAKEIENVLICDNNRSADNTRIIGIPFNELTAFKKVPESIWRTQLDMDPERDIHTLELYALWFEKKEFVLKTIHINPFGSQYFVWCDAGICRYPQITPHLQRFPLENKIPRGQMLVLQIDRFLPQDFIAGPDGIYGEFTHRASVGVGILASDASGWKRWNDAYDAMINRYYNAERFIGKDQNIMGSMILSDPTLAIPIYSPTGVPSSILRWFYLLFFLSGVFPC